MPDLAHRAPALSVLAAFLVTVSLTSCESRSRLVSPSASPPETGRSAAVAAAAASDDDDLDLSRWAGAGISGPTVITQPGVYRVTQDFSVDAATGDGIVVRSSSVVLLLGRHTISGPGDKLGRAVVVESAEKVVVHGGRLRSFGIGVALVGARGCAIRGVEMEGADAFADPANGIPPQIGILLVNSAENRVVRNRLAGVNLGLFVRGAGSYDNRLRRNEVTGGHNGLLGICYNPASGQGAAGPTGDYVSRNSLLRFGKGIQTSAGSADNSFTRNVIEFYTVAYEDLNGTNEFENNRATQITPH